MQVADQSAAASARDSIKAAMKELALRIKNASEPTGYQPSFPAKFAIQYIADSTRLSGPEKKSLVSLLAMADQYAGTDPKTVEAVMALANVMGMNRKEGTFKHHTYQQMLEDYQQDRARFDPKTYETNATDVAAEIAKLRANVEAAQGSVATQDKPPSGLAATVKWPLLDLSA